MRFGGLEKQNGFAEVAGFPGLTRISRVFDLARLSL
jgi:hypothetical protein